MGGEDCPWAALHDELHPWEKSAGPNSDPWAATAGSSSSRGTTRHEEESDAQVPDGVDYPLKAADWAHVAGDAALDGGAHYGHITEELAGDALKIAGGTASRARQVFGGLTAGVFAPLAIVGGILDGREGIEELRAGDPRAAATLLQSAATVGGGVAGIGGLAGSGTMAAASPLLLSGASGVQLGRYGDKQVEKLGWKQNREGENVGASGWMADRAQRADEAVSNALGDGIFGHIAGVGAGLATTVGMIPAGAGLALAGAGTGAGRALAHQTRANNYAGRQVWQPRDHWEGIQGFAEVDPKTGKQRVVQRGTDEARAVGQEMADYDDARAEAIARSKREHPERWATPESKNQTYGQWIDQTLFRMRAATATYQT